jgi:hypothetical protein
MTTSGKLEVLLSTGITTEAQALQLVVLVRKLLEDQREKNKQANKPYEYLKFHCDWALHSQLDGKTTQKILKLWDAANGHLKNGVELHNLPPHIGGEINRISKMKYFEDELEEFLKDNELPGIDATRSDGWIHFEHLYAKIVEDSPLVMTSKDASASVASVTLNIDMAKASKQDGDLLP